MSRNGAIWPLAALWCATVLTATFAADIVNPDSKNLSDFHTNFWLAGYLVAHNQAGLIYPAMSATSPAGTQFDAIMHQMLPNIPDRYGVFLYLPLMAVLCAPFGLLPGNWALLAWQLVTVLGLVLYAVLMARQNNVSWWHVFVSTFLLLPIVSTLWIGQCSVLLGLLPLAFGYFLACRKNDFVAGLVWSLMIIKPQYCPIPLFTAVAAKRWRLLGGFVTGCAVIMVLSVFCLTPEVFGLWLHAASALGEKAMSGQIVVPSRLVACVPGCILTTLSQESRVTWKWAIYAATGAVGFVSLAAVLFAASKRIPRRHFLEVALIVNTLFLPTYSRLLNYDLALFMLAVHLGMLRLSAVDAVLAKRFRTLLLTTTVVLSAQVLVSVCWGSVTLGWWFVGVFAAIAAWCGWIVTSTDLTGERC